MAKFKTAIVDHYEYGHITVQLSPEATYWSGTDQYFCADDPELGIFRIRGL